MTKEKIISLLPYSEPFLFVDSIIEVNEDSITGEYRFKEDEYFYRGHFSKMNGVLKRYPVTPGVILIETMAQIGLVCFGIYLIKDELSKYEETKIAMVSAQVDFFLPVFPGETVRVISNKIYFRFGKLKCNIEMRNSNNGVVCKGIISGMIRMPHEKQ